MAEILWGTILVLGIFLLLALLGTLLGGIWE